jgi:hypothetical protein
MKSHVVQHFPRQRITVFIATIVLSVLVAAAVLGSGAAAVGLALLLIGAIGTHARAHDLSRAAPAVGLLLLTIAAALTRLASS